MHFAAALFAGHLRIHAGSPVRRGRGRRRPATGATGRLDMPARVGRERQTSQGLPLEPASRDPQMTGSSRSAREKRKRVVDDGIRELQKFAMRRATTARVLAAAVALAALSNSPALT
jgi:hypothetical protein